MRVEGKAAVTPDGVDVLTTYPRDLRPFRDGTDVVLAETAKTMKTGTSLKIYGAWLGQGHSPIGN